MKTYSKFIILIIIVSVLVYANSVRNGFVFDDKFIIQKNDVIRDMSNISRIFKSTYWPQVQGEPNKGLYRPLTVLSYAVNYSIGGLNPAGYHVINILTHTFNGVLLFIIMLFVLKEDNNAELIALAVALLFVSHPVNTEAVSGVVGRADTMATLFVLLSFLFYIRIRPAAPRRAPIQQAQGRHRGKQAPGTKAAGLSKTVNLTQDRVSLKYYIMSLAFFAAGLLTKEIAVTLPGMIILYDMSFAGKAGFKLKNNLRYYAGYLAVAASYMMIRFSVVGSVGPTAIKQVMQTHGLAVRFFTVAKVFASYIKLMFYPLNLYCDYNSSFPYALSVTEPGVIISIILLFAVLLLFVVSYRKRKQVFFSLGWFLAAIFPVSQIIPIGAIMAERFLYLPVIGFCMLMGICVSEIIKKKKAPVFMVFIAFIVLFFSARAIRRNLDWYSDYNLWTNTVNAKPEVGRAYYELGTAALKEKKYDETIEAMEKCIELSRKVTDNDRKRYALLPETYLHWVWMNLGLAYQKKDRIDNAIYAYKKSMEVKPDYAAAYNNLGNVYLEKGMVDEAILEFRHCIAIGPNVPEGHYNLGIAYSRKGNDDRALELYKKAAGIGPGYAEAWNAAGIIEYNRGNYQRAAELFKKAFEANPNFTAAKNNYDLSIRQRN